LTARLGLFASKRRVYHQSHTFVRTSDNTEEADCAASLHLSRTVHAYLLGSRRVQKPEDDGFFHVTPDWVVYLLSYLG